MARLRSSAAVGAAGLAKDGGVLLFRPCVPNPPVSRSSLLPSYAVVAIDPLTTNDGSALRSEPLLQPANARSSGSARFDKEPLRTGLLERYKSGDVGQRTGRSHIGGRCGQVWPRRCGMLSAMRNLLAMAALVLAFLLGAGLAWHFAHRA